VRLIELPSGSDLYVTTPEGTLIGTLVLDELKGHLPDHSLLQMTVAADVMNTHFASVNPDMSLSEVSHLFSQTDAERLPVVDARSRLLGTIAKRDVLRHVRF
jgi:CIC family chloride channel protein